jgi:stage II sporulation protein D
MKKFSKLMILNIIISLLSMMCFVPYGYAYNSNEIPERIKIGIRYGQNAVPNVSLHSVGGFEFGYYQGNEFISLARFDENDKINIQKDISANKQPPYHIQIGNEFGSKQEAEIFIKSLPDLANTPYIAYENGWKVWFGMCATYEKAIETCDSIQSIIPNIELNILPIDNKRVQVLDEGGNILLVYNTKDQPYHFRSQGIIQMDGKNFRGDIIIQRYSDSDLTVINDMSLTEYLYGVVPREMSGSWPLEAQKAQAVAARNYAILSMKKHAQHGFDLCASTHCQVYGGYESEHPRSRQAVDETKNKVLTCNGKLISAFYHSNSGGRTENSENVWSTPLDYIKGVDDPYSIGSPNDSWTKPYTKKEIEGILASKGLSVGELKDISIQEKSVNGRVLKLEIIGSAGKRILEKEQIRSVFGYNNIKSTWFEIKKDATAEGSLLLVHIVGDPMEQPKSINLQNQYVITASGLKEITASNGQNVFNGNKYVEISDYPSIPSGQYVFNGKGWGHGLGMSQWGAKKMAEEGFNYEQILTHYYTGTKVE